MAISFAGWLTHWIIYFRFFLANRATVKQLENNTRKTFATENASQVVPSNIASSPKLSVKREVLDSSQRWELFHVRPKTGRETKKVVVYWHGGAFIRGTSPKHWDAVARVVNESHCPVVVPIYTLAPLSTARDWNIVALDFILKLAKDARYADYEIVMMGDSAGGWMSMRLLQAMCEVSCGDKSDRQGDVDDTLMRMGTAIMISPFINSEPTDELIEASKSDCWLSLNLFTFVSRLWVNGPAEYPKLLEAMPTDTKNRYTTLEKHPLYSGEVCLDHNLDIFKTYIKLHPEHGPFRFSTSIGTADMCHAPVLRMQKTFDAMDKKVVVSDTIVEEGLYHVYALLSTPETEKAWVRIREVLAA